MDRTTSPLVYYAALAAAAFTYAAQGAGMAEVQAAAGLSTASLGLVSFAALAAALVAQVVLTRYGDHLHLRIVLCATLVLAAAGLVGTALVESLPVLVVTRCLCAAAVSSIAPIVYGRLAADHRTPGRAIATAAGVYAAGSVLGVGTFAALLRMLSLPTTYWVLTAAPLVAGAAAALAASPTAVRSKQAERASADLLRDRRLRRAVLACVSMSLLVGVVDALWDRFVTDVAGEFADPNVLNSGTYLAACSAYIVFAAVGGRIADRGTRITPRLAVLTGAAAVAGYAVATSPTLVLTASFVDGAVQGFFDPILLAFVAAAAPATRSVAAQSLVGAATAGASVVVGLVSPVVYHHLGAPLTFAATATTMLLLAVFALRPSSVVRATEAADPPAFANAESPVATCVTERCG